MLKLQSVTGRVHPLISGLKIDHTKRIDLTKDADYLADTNLTDTTSFNEIIFNKVLNGKVGIGGFFEERSIYQRSKHFSNNTQRSLHLGLDIWIGAGTELHSPLPGKIHSLQDNKGFGDYGPTIIVSHIIDDMDLFVLYGHLSRKSLSAWQAGDQVNAGDTIGQVGNFPENGDWPPHLHWQVMTDMLGNYGDFPGVAATKDYAFYLQICVNPEYILTFDD